MERFAKKISIMFVLLQTLLYVAFLTYDLTGKSVTISSSIKYTIIILCFCYALLTMNKSADKSILFCLRVGLFFTLISDLFLLILDIYLYGVLTFILVQLLYGVRIDLSVFHTETIRKTALLRGFLIRLLVQVWITFIICYTLQKFSVQLDRVLIASVFYFICILTNTVRAIKIASRKKKSRSFVFFTFGMILFLLCDINVGLFNLSEFISLPVRIYQIIDRFSSVLMWAFYAPSQVLIALSVHKSTRLSR